MTIGDDFPQSLPALAESRETAIRLPAVGNPDDEDEQDLVADIVDDPVLADVDSISISATGQLSYPGQARIVGQRSDNRAKSILRLPA